MLYSRPSDRVGAPSARGARLGGCRLKTELIHAANPEATPRAVDVLRAGGLVAFPTDTVYGLAAMPWNTQAVERLYEAKERPSERAIPLLLSDAEHLPRVAIIPPLCRESVDKLVDRFWPGALTLVLLKTDAVPEAVSHGTTVAVRVPALSLARALIRAAGGVLAVTSANISGQPSPVTAEEVASQLGGRIDLIVNGGACPGGVPSTIVDCTASPPTLLRRGAIAPAELAAVVGAIHTMRQGFTLWFTGLSGAGKTTIAKRIEEEMRARGLRVERLDGDIVRQGLTRDLGFSKEDRDKNIERVTFVAKLLTRNNVGVLCAFISPYRARRALSRQEIGEFIEVYVECPLEECARRDVKGMYAKAFAGEIPNFTGVSDPYEPPENPEIVCHTAEETPEQSAAKIIAYLEQHGYIPAQA